MKQKHHIRRAAKILQGLLVVSLLFNFQFSTFNSARAQMKGGVAVKVTRKTQMMNGKRYFIHIVEQGQTVYAISRAYGLKEVEAITKKDIHFLQVGDTVWLPCKGQRLPDGTTAPQATDAPAATPQGTAAQPASSEARGQHAAQASAATQISAAAPQVQTVYGPGAEVRQRVNPQSIVVSVMMPLYLSQMESISTSKFDVEQRGKTTYKSLEFIQFYEGLLLGLDQLEKMGYNVTLNVVDVEGNSDEVVEQAFRSHKVAESDLLIAMLTRQPFEKVSKLARAANLFVVNPVSDREEIVKDNPYVFKCMPSVQAKAKATVEAIHNTLPTAEVYVIHSGARAEKSALAALTAEMDKVEGMRYRLVDWAKAQKLTTMLKNDGQTVVVSLYDQDKAKNRIYASQLLNKLSSIKNNTPYLFTFVDWTSLYTDIDFAQLQNLNYHTFYGDWLMTDDVQRAFVERFREEFKTEPISGYAGMANDIILYFVSGLHQRGTAFFESPVIPQPKGMIYPLRFSHDRQDYGYENGEAVLYRMSDFQFKAVK
ncbi:MAG: ABC transporter substrate-binding protein [Bacteroidales bacterium]|nr:ABC transporter substrate-binding protein [Bacteroidales bacterium]